MNQNTPEIYDIQTQLPLIGKMVIVVTPGFRCLGYLDGQGVWRHAKDAKMIEGVMGWCPHSD